jgi:hypothetical protein
MLLCGLAQIGVPLAFANAGSQRWIQVAVNRRPDVLLSSLRAAGAISASTTIDWASPLELDGCCEYRDAIALKKAGVEALPVRSLNDFWPARGPVWDAIGRTSDDVAIFVEAKAHIPEAASPHYFLRKVNGLSSKLVFVYVTHDEDMSGPESESEWHGAIRLLHAALGLPAQLEQRGVFDAFLDVRRLQDGG